MLPDVIICCVSWHSKDTTYKKWISKNYWKIIILCKSPMISLQRILNMPVWFYFCVYQRHCSFIEYHNAMYDAISCNACMQGRWQEVMSSKLKWHLGKISHHMIMWCEFSPRARPPQCAWVFKIVFIIHVKINIYQILFGLMRC